jgi:uncharacterized membrane protein YraQ (UPF0718 family)
MDAIIHALAITGSMTWQIAWALILGFALSAVVQALVRKSVIVRLLGDDRPRTLAVAAGLGAASSSCSYAAVALARSLFRKGAAFTAAMAFEIASTNLVIEFGVILALLMGWQFTVAEFADIYRKYYGPRMALFILGTFYAAMVAAGYVIEIVFGWLGLIPDRASATIPDQGVSWDYTTWLNIAFGLLAAILLVRFARTGGLPMLRMMGGSPAAEHGHDHHEPAPSVRDENA